MSSTTRRLSYKMYPTPRQAAALDRKLWWLRDLWNAALAERRDAWEKQSKSISFYDQCKGVKILARDLDGWKGCVHTHEAQSVLKRLQVAFEAFFRRAQDGDEEPGYPRFKGRNRFKGWGYKEHGNGFRMLQDSTMRHGKVRISNVGEIRLRGVPRTPGRVLSADVTRRHDGWFLSVVVDTDCAERPAAPAGSANAFDLGVETARVEAREDGTFRAVANPRLLAAELDAIREDQRALSKLERERKVSKNAAKRARKRLSRRYAKVAARRKDFLHKESARIVRESALIITEELRVQNMTASARGTEQAPGTRVKQKAGLNRSILDVGMSTFLNMIRYKAEEAGADFLLADTRRLKPSQRCPDCDAVRKKPLSVRVHECECGCRLSRDQAAAKVLLNCGLAEHARLHPAGTAGALIA